jgi:ribosomal protein S12
MCLPLLMSIGACDNRPRVYPVKGKVQFADGSPVKVGIVETKSPRTGIQATGNIQLDGSFELTTFRNGDGAVAGPHTCVVIQFVRTEEIPNHKPSTVGVVHPKHSSYTTSGLSLEVSETGPNELTLQVEGIAKSSTLEKSSDHARGIGGHEPKR